MLRKFYPLSVGDIPEFKKNLIDKVSEADNFCMLEANNYEGYPYSTFGSLIAIDSIEHFIPQSSTDTLTQFQRYLDNHEDWLFGYFNYDLKNEIHNMGTFPKGNLWHPISFFTPRWLIKIEGNEVFLGVRDVEDIATFDVFLHKNTSKKTDATSLQLNHIPQKSTYLSNVERLKEHIQRGDLYEVNYCIQWEAKGALNISEAFGHLNELSQAPFTCLFRQGHRYMLCASPERFLKKKSNKLIAQPIKGTKGRSLLPGDDRYQRELLYNHEKERAENIMIVDLVRNDLSQIAKTGTVEVEELCKVYTFKQVHQMISTITAQLDTQKTKLSKIIRATFPMGSMTGAPKRSAIMAIDKYEQGHRDLFSGAIGYITPKGDFDFNVIIRSIFYDDETMAAKVCTGSAITYDSKAEAEYEECLIKAKALLQSIGV